MKITFRQLRIFNTVAEQGSMLRAAAVLNLTPPAVSLQIRQFETQVGLSLFHRETRRLTLSPAGEHLRSYVKRLLGDLKEVENAIAQFKRPDHGVLTIGILSTAEYLVPRLLVPFQKEHPNIELKIRSERNWAQLTSLMGAAEIDLCIMARSPRDLAARSERFAVNPYVFICSAKHPLLGKARISVKDLGELSFIARERGSGTRVVMDVFFKKHRYAPQISMESSSNETIKQSVMAGLGVGFLSVHCIGLELSHGLLAILPIANTPVLGTWNLAHLQSRALSPVAESFRHFAIEQGESLINDPALLSLRPGKKIITGHESNGRKSRGDAHRRQA